MPKHGNTYFLQLTRAIFNESQYQALSINAKWLFCVLNELEQRFTVKGLDTFTRTNAELAHDAGMSMATLKRAKAELLNTDLITHRRGSLRYRETGTLTKHHVSYYQIKK